MPPLPNDAEVAPPEEDQAHRPESAVALAPDVCRRRREVLHLSIAELARRAGLTEQTVERFERAAVRPRPVTIVALRNALRRSEQKLAIPRLQALAQTPGDEP